MLRALCSLKCESSYKITLITTTRAEWGLLSPLAKALKNNPNFKLTIIASGSHLQRRFGNTHKEIQKDGFTYQKINILQDSNVTNIMARTISKFGRYFKINKPDMIILLGDRYECFCVGIAAFSLNIPIAHLCGGESTQGASDEGFRHCLSKLSYLHFTTTDIYKNRVIQLGESPNRVFNVGSLAVENIKNLTLLDKESFANAFDISKDFLENFCILTFHPTTIAKNSNDDLAVLDSIISILLDKKINILATKANADLGGENLNNALNAHTKANPTRIILRDSLGRIGYLSAIRLAKFVIGNSSSGISEVPLIQKLTINIGDRQKGRYMPSSVICVDSSNEFKENLRKVLDSALSVESAKQISTFGTGQTSKQIVEILQEFLSENKINLQKEFYDLLNTK